MRLLTIIAVTAILLVCVSAFAEEAAPKVEIPLYPGSEATLELGMAGPDIMPTLNAMMPMIAMGMPGGAEALDPDAIAAIFRDVTRIDVLTLDASKAKDTEKSVADYYAKKLPKGSWAKVVSMKDPKNGTIRVYAKPGGEGLYGFRVRRIIEDGKASNKAEVAKIEGKVDYPKLIELFMKFSAAQKPKTESATAPAPSE